ncbi:glycolate oxidase subunit GlcE [Rhodoferax aquaticus]|uniref:Glycolate oxidase subunit GlcE n=2 Tax=Rhodoferax aquaticus TaxID=2527691 RepID=A0A515EW58_9BURK|nr:glycolate oxidase subunit GlcE [Rhodoferax aquaticus]
MDSGLALIRQQIQDAVAAKTPLRIRGGGTKDFYGNTLKGVVLDTHVLSGVLAYAPSELVVTVGAGTPLHELEALLAEHGQCLPFEPPHFRWSQARDATSQATVGGMVAAGLAGPARANAGGVRDYVLGLEMVNGRGEHLTFGGQVMKNVAGYDVSRLMVGAMGTLGLITSVSLKVLPVAPAHATLVFDMDQTAALEQLHRWGAQPLPLNASRWQTAEGVHGANAAPAGTLHLRLAGAVAAVEAACTQLLAQIPGQRLDATVADAQWAAVRNQTAAFFERPSPEHALWRVSVPQTAPVLPWDGAQLVEWHGGLRWVWVRPEAASPLQAWATQQGGNAMQFVAANPVFMGAEDQFASKNVAEMGISRALKASFDPHGVFNPGRLFADF